MSKNSQKIDKNQAFWPLSDFELLIFWVHLDACENLGAIVKDRVEKRMLSSRDSLDNTLIRILCDMEFNTELFSALLESNPARPEAVRKAGDGHTTRP